MGKGILVVTGGKTPMMENEMPGAHLWITKIASTKLLEHFVHREPPRIAGQA